MVCLSLLMVGVFEASEVVSIHIEVHLWKDNLKKEPLYSCAMGHLDDVGMGYFEHMIGAYKLAFRFALGAIQLLIHGLIPGIFIDAGKNTSDAYKR